MANVHSGFREIFFKRILCILLWHIAIQSFVLQLIASVELSADPLYWLVSWLQNLVKPKFFIITLFQFFLSMVSVITESTQYLKVEHYDGVSRFRYLCKKLSPNNFIWFFVYFLQGILSAIVFFIALKSYFVDSLAAAAGDADTGNQVTEIIIILLNNAIWINATFFMYNFVYQRSFKYFSLVQRSRYIILPAIIVAARDAAVRSFYHCLLFVALYLVKGQSCCMFMCYILAVKCNLTYGIVFSPFVLYSLWLLNAFIIFNNLILKMLFDMYLTNKISFPVTADGYAKQSDAFTLKDALGTDNIPLVQYLGYYDLNVISQFDTARRKQVFALSYPGGHPYTWRDLSEEALKLITDTVANLEKIVAAKPAPPPAETQKFPSAGKHYKMRYLSQSHFLDEKAALLERKRESTLLWKCTNFVKNIRLVAYFAETMTEKQLESALQHYQALSLACYSLSNLAAASMSDDKYGVVQQDLSTITSVFLQLNLTLNKLAVVVNKKPNSPVSQIKKHLTSVVKSSLYKMSIHFGPYVKDLALSSEDEKMFNSFILYKS